LRAYVAKSPVNAAVVGLGWWGRTIVQALAGNAVIRPVLAVDPLEPGQAAARELGLPVTPDFKAALDRSDIDAIILCTPHVHHAAQIEAAAAHGKHVFCEKPLCTTGDEVARAVKAVQAAGVVLGIGHERRFEPAVKDLRARIKAGELGVPLLLEANFSQDKFLTLARDSWRFSLTETPVGPLAATGVHLLDLAIAVLGTPKRLWAQLSTRGSDFPNGDTLGVTMQFESGATALLGASLATPFDGRLAVFGSQGWMEIRDRTHPEQPTGWDVTTALRSQERSTKFWPPHPAVRDNLEIFARAILGEGQYPVGLDEMVANVRSYDAVVRSVRGGGIETI
jgi:predicted dehydrogenase